MTKRFELTRLLDTLADHEVACVVIGGVAVTAHRVPLMTFDLDVCYRRDRENLDRLADALRDLHARLRGAPADVPFLVDAETILAGDHFTFETDAGPLDIMATPAGGFDYATLAAHATEAMVHDRKVLIASVDDLITMKRAAGRPKDLNAILHLEALREILGEE